LYGVDNYSKSNEFLIKSKKTFKETYGVTNPSKCKTIQDKKIKTSNLKYRVDNFSQCHLSDATRLIISDKKKFKKYCEGKTILQVADGLGMSYSGPIKVAERHGLIGSFTKATRSSYELKIKSLLDTLHMSYIQNSKSIISPYQLDFYLPDLNIAIEVGSMYFHCENSSNKSKHYHQNKWKICRDKNITLLQYFDDDLLNHFNLIESKIKRLCKLPMPVIGSRKLEIQCNKLSFEDEKEFLRKYHLQHESYDRNVVYSAHYNNEIVGIMTLSLQKNKAKIIRYSTNVNFSFPGLFTRFIKRFINEYNFKGEIETFSNNNYGDGKLYESSGFTCKKITSPGYHYTKNYLTKESRKKYMKHLLLKKFNLDVDFVKNNTEWEIMKSLRYDRIWDSGHKHWTLLV